MRLADLLAELVLDVGVAHLRGIEGPGKVGPLQRADQALVAQHLADDDWFHATRGFEVELPIPLFDWGQARTARAEATYVQSVARIRDVAVRARSEAREAWHGWRTAHDLAKFHDSIEEVAGSSLLRDVVTLDRVICCYPDMPALVDASAAHARRLFGFVAPRERWLTRIGLGRAYVNITRKAAR